jgi:hypothetical protein
MPNAPIQVILNADSFRHDREKRNPVSAGKDFFEGLDEAFHIHQQRLQSQVQVVLDQISNRNTADNVGDVGYVKVSLRTSALAKSHRPIDAIFRQHVTPSAGGGRLGEMITEVNSKTLGKVDEAIRKAETTVRTKPDKKTQEPLPVPTRYRCEVGAIEKIELWGKSDRRRFDLKEGIDWLSDTRTGQAYIVELFERPPHQAQLDLLPTGKRRLFESLAEGLRSFGPGLIARLPEGLPEDSVVIEVKLTTSDEPAAIFLQSRNAHHGRDNSRFDADESRHGAVIGFLETHPLVREIHLPNLLVQSNAAPSIKEKLPSAPLPKPIKDGQYPKVGIIDGGIGDDQTPWILYRHRLLAPEHAQLDHGSFIGGLVIAARSMNATLASDPDGCLIADIDVFPDQNQPGVFEQYFPDGLNSFFDELAVAVEICRMQYGIRVFNLSLNVVSPVHLDRYSLEARRLDQIADQNDVIFVISAGNLDVGKMRPEWPNDDTKAAAILAAHRDDQLFIPAESVRNLSVAAINPVGLSNSVAGAPARYSRRGPGLRAGVKPDLCHVGGSGTPCPTQKHGLFSRSPAGEIVSGCGTSYAAPLVAKTLAALDAEIEGEPSRETLMGLAIHHAQLPSVLTGKAFAGVAHQLVGFGQPSAARTALEGADHQITLLFSSRIFQGKTLEFPFTWPPSLVLPESKCRGDVRLTLVSTPHLDHRFGEELVRANIEAALQQETQNGKFHSELEPTYVFFSDEEKASEVNLIEHKFKWAPIKAFGAHIPKGRGKSSNWRLVVNYLTRAGERLPDEGIPFSVLLTISDPDKQRPIFQEMRQILQASGIQTADIRTAARVSPRV